MQLDTVSLPDSLVWTNEFEHNQVEQTTDRTLSGALSIQTGTKLYGREIRLVGGDHGGWISRATAIALRALESEAAKVMVLSGLLDAPDMNVVFDRSAPAFESQMIMRYDDPDAATWYSCALRLITVE
jgi:hypothetical protein